MLREICYILRCDFIFYWIIWHLAFEHIIPTWIDGAVLAKMQNQIIGRSAN
jgi:hypothetical protein